jgi:hypothetical protein
VARLDQAAHPRGLPVLWCNSRECRAGTLVTAADDPTLGGLLGPEPKRACSGYSLTLSYEGRNRRGMRVLAARCSCGWVHMTAYPLFRKRSRAKYLRARFTDHLYESWARPESGPLPSHVSVPGKTLADDAAEHDRGLTW